MYDSELARHPSVICAVCHPSIMISSSFRPAFPPHITIPHRSSIITASPTAPSSRTLATVAISPFLLHASPLDNLWFSLYAHVHFNYRSRFWDGHSHIVECHFRTAHAPCPARLAANFIDH